MSDELNQLQQAAADARAKANELFAALDEASSPEEIAASEAADQAAKDAETAFEEAKAKAEADPAAQGGSFAQADGGTGATAQADADESRTGYAEKGLRAGDPCVCPDGRKGTVHAFDAGLICIPNHDQGE